MASTQLKPKAVPSLRLVWINDWFVDILKRRDGWKEILRPAIFRGRTGFSCRIGPLLIFWTKSLRYRQMLWLQEDGLHAPKP